MAQAVKHLPEMWETWVRSLGWEDPLEKEMATHSSTLAWKIPCMEEPGRLQSMGLQRVGHYWATSLTSISMLLSPWIFQGSFLLYCVTSDFCHYQELYLHASLSFKHPTFKGTAFLFLSHKQLDCNFFRTYYIWKSIDSNWICIVLFVVVVSLFMCSILFLLLKYMSKKKNQNTRLTHL